MHTKPLVGTSIVAVLLTAFLGLAALGAYMMCTSPYSPEATQAELDVSAAGVKISVKTLVVGVLVFLAGAAGLILLAIKVPVKQILGYQTTRSSGDTLQHMLTTAIPVPVLSREIERIPLLLWMLPAVRRRAVRAK
jgi:hypothetical protein